MTAVLSAPNPVAASPSAPPTQGPTAELRRFSAGLRVIIALLCTALFVSFNTNPDPLALGVLLAYGLWSAHLLWIEANGQARHSVLWSYWVDVAWAVLTMKLWSAGALMMGITLVYPVALATIGFGLGHGLLLALFALLAALLTLASVVDNTGELMRHLQWRQILALLLLMGLVPAAALVARPMGLRLRWLAMLGALEARLDSRRGLDATCAELVSELRQITQADVVGLVLPSTLGAPAMIAGREDGSFRSTAEVHAGIETLLSQAPSCPMTHVARRRWWDPRPRTRLHADLPMPQGLSNRLAELARTLDVATLHVAPLTRYARHHGHFFVGYRAERKALYDAIPIANAAPELMRIIERATLVDQVQEESAGHERERIGRDLHDSAIQPYLGLKYAVEAVALHIAPDNPARADVEALAQMVNREVLALRELISGLRTGNEHGDSTLVPAVRRQVRRFSRLFGIDVEINCPDRLVTTRAIASSLFHMINEALNNIRKHTIARRVWINLSVQASWIHLVIRDDAGTAQGHPVDDFYPTSLNERTAELHGTLQISRPDGLNTELVIEIPL